MTLNSISQWVYNMIYSLLNPIIEIIKGTIPLFNTAVYYINDLMEMLVPYIRYFCDALFVNNIFLAVFGAILMWAVTTKILIYAVKLVAKWWDTII